MSYRGAVVDLDGTVYRGGTLIPGAAAGLDALRAAGVEVVAVSNDPTRSPTAFVERLAGMGLSIEPERVVAAGTVTAAFLAREYSEARLFVVGSSGLEAQLRAAGCALTDDPLGTDVLVASYDRGFDYDRLTAALRAIEAGATFVGTDPDRTIPGPDGPVPGSGAIVRAVAGVTDREPDRVLGKPSAETASAVARTLGVDPAACLLIGDRLDTDIAMGGREGMTTALVLTGVADRADLDDAAVQPDHVLDSLGEVGTLLDEGA
jgi:4-nitrophenyl phosphatase